MKGGLKTWFFLIKLFERRAQKIIFPVDGVDPQVVLHPYLQSIEKPRQDDSSSESNNHMARYDANENVVRTSIEVMEANDKQKEIKSKRKWGMREPQNTIATEDETPLLLLMMSVEQVKNNRKRTLIKHNLEIQDWTMTK